MIVKKLCKVCGGEFEAYDKPGASTIRTKSLRRSNSLTCSTKCSKIMDYNREYKRQKNVS